MKKYLALAFCLISLTVAYSQMSSFDTKINCVFLVNDNLATHSQIKVYMYLNEGGIDTIAANYIPGEIGINSNDYNRIVNKEADSIKIELFTWLHEGGSVIDGYYHENSIERVFLFEENSFLQERSFRVYIIEEMRIKKYRKRWGLKCKEGFVITYIHPKSSVPVFVNVPCYKGIKY
jgi:hypothetical protein